MKLKILFLILFCLVAACSRPEPAKESGDIQRAMALYDEVYAEYVTKALHPGTAVKKLDEALKLVPEDHEYHRKIRRLKARIQEQWEPPQPPPEPDREEAVWIPPPDIPDETPGRIEKKEVSELLDAAKKLVREKKYEEAAALLEKAARLEGKNCQVLVSLGIVYARWGKREPSAQNYEKFLRLCPQHMQAPQIRSILKQYYEFKGQGKRLPPPPTGRYKFNLKGVGVIRESTTVNKKLESQGLGAVDVGVSGAWAFVYVDGEKIRVTPLLNHELKAGEHLVELKDSDGNKMYSWTINLRPGRLIKLLLQ